MGCDAVRFVLLVVGEGDVDEEESFGGVVRGGHCVVLHSLY